MGGRRGDPAERCGKRSPAGKRSGRWAYGVHLKQGTGRKLKSRKGEDPSGRGSREGAARVPSAYLGETRPRLWSNNGGVQRRLRSAPGARGAPHHLRRMLAGLRGDARRPEKHHITPCSEAPPPHPGPPLPRRGHYRLSGDPPGRAPRRGFTGFRSCFAPPSLGCDNNGARLGSPAPAGPRPASPLPLPGLRRAPGRHL